MQTLDPRIRPEILRLASEPPPFPPEADKRKGGINANTGSYSPFKKGRGPLAVRDFVYYFLEILRR